jgi:hypothetical protein
MARRTDKDAAPGGERAPKAPNGPPCRKCGEHKPWLGPTYQKGKRVTVLKAADATRFKTEHIDTVESLVWTCTVCGYARHEACKDEE